MVVVEIFYIIPQIFLRISYAFENFHKYVYL